jgi:Holliday junction resolvase RusA-like endonuclease
MPTTDKVEMIIKMDVIPYVRMTQRSKYVDDRAIAYQDWMAHFRIEIHKKLMKQNYPQLLKKQPMYAMIYFYEKKVRHNRDLDNMLKAVMDACQGVLFRNDMWFDQIETVRVASEDGPAVIIELGYLDE